MPLVKLCDAYRYGFNGKLKDNEWGGTGNSLDYGARMEDTRVGRFRSVDPITQQYPMLTPYQFASNSPIQAIDLDGKEAWVMVWASQSSDKNGKTQLGHAGIIVQNYKQVNENGVQKAVPDGTYSYYDLWPRNQADVTNPTQSVNALYQSQTFDMKNKDGSVNTSTAAMENWMSKNDPSQIPSSVGYGPPEASEGGAPPNGILKINLSPQQTIALTNNIQAMEKQDKLYNGRDNNCSTFISEVLNEDGVNVPKENNTIWFAPLKSQNVHQSFYTPNNLYNQVKKNPHVIVVKDAGATTSQNYNDAVITPEAKREVKDNVLK